VNQTGTDACDLGAGIRLYPGWGCLKAWWSRKPEQLRQRMFSALVVPATYNQHDAISADALTYDVEY
jgi:hypothetical protein